MTMAMGITASAYAANPFSDVPAGHWAYDSIAKLAAAGVVDGYGATFGGEKLMTRYEMAQIVAKAMAKGANVDKLSAEFADELDALGVRVAKLEKKVDNVRITGQIRYSYQDHQGNAKAKTGHNLRTRIFVNGEINDNWSYTGMLQNIQKFHDKGTNPSNQTSSDDVELDRAYLQGRLGGLKITAGRWNEFFINDTILDEYIDGVQATYTVGGVKLLGLVSKYSSTAYGDHGPSYTDSDNRLYIAGASGKLGIFDLAFNYFNSEDGYGQRAIYNVNAGFKFCKNFYVDGRYMWTDDRVDSNESKDGWYAQLNYKGADPSKANTWGLRASYFMQPKNVWISPTYDCATFKDNGGYDGWRIGGDYTFAKNIMWSLDYYDVKSKDNAKTDRTWFSQLFFMF